MKATMVLILLLFTFSSVNQASEIILNEHDWETYPYVGRFNEKGYFYTISVDANGEFHTEVIGKFHSLKLDAEGNFQHSIVTGKDGQLHPAMGRPRFTMSPETKASWKKIDAESSIIGKYDENNIFYSYVLNVANKKHSKDLIGKFHSFRFGENGKIIGSTVIDEKGELHTVTGWPSPPASDAVGFPETAVAPISPVKPNINYIYGRFDNDGVFYQLKTDSNGRSRPEMLGKLHSVKLYDGRSSTPEYYLVIDKSGNLHSVKEYPRTVVKSRERMWDVFFRTQDDLKKQAKKAEASNKIMSIVKYIFWIFIIIFCAGYHFRKDVLKVYRRIKEHFVKDI